MLVSTYPDPLHSKRSKEVSRQACRMKGLIIRNLQWERSKVLNTKEGTLQKASLTLKTWQDETSASKFFEKHLPGYHLFTPFIKYACEVGKTPFQEYNSRGSVVSETESWLRSKRLGKAAVKRVEHSRGRPEQTGLIHFGHNAHAWVANFWIVWSLFAIAGSSSFGEKTGD